MSADGAGGAGGAGASGDAVGSCGASGSASARTSVRPRDLGVPFGGAPGPANAITDVPGTHVGMRTRIEGAYDDPHGGPVVRTGVTVVHPLGPDAAGGVAAGRFVFNGMGEMTGGALLDEYGVLYGPLALTNTLSVGVVRDALVAWSVRRGLDPRDLRGRTKPVVSETWDGRLNDVYGQHLRAEDVWAAADGATDGPVREGSVGGGTGMTSFGFKAGTGTASRRVAHPLGPFVLGALVQSNFGRREQLTVAGVPVGRLLQAPDPVEPEPPRGDGSIVVLLATDAPLLPSQLTAVAKRATLALGRVGSIGSTTSGDLFLAWSTANRSRYLERDLRRFEAVPTERLDPLFQAAVEATEEAIVSALVAAEPMSGVGGAWYPSLPHARLRAVLARHGRLADGA